MTEFDSPLRSLRAFPLLLLALMSAVLLATTAIADRTADKLQSYSIDYNRTTVSGLSAGAFFAVQFHVAFSANIIGAGIAAGGPYYCAQGILTTATTECMTVPLMINVAKLVSLTKSMRDIDNVTGLAKSKVFIFSGSADTVVDPGVVKKLEEWYEAFLDHTRIKTQYSVPSEHAWVTADYGNSCKTLGTPYINKCKYALGSSILEWILGANDTSPVVSANLFTFDQSEFYTSAESMDSLGYVYVPAKCQSKQSECLLHIAFHGCLQGRETIHEDFVLHTDLLSVAEANNIIVLFPQVKKSTLLPFNPNGCFDWWGYAGSNYATRNGKQMAAVRKMMNRIAGMD